MDPVTHLISGALAGQALSGITGRGTKKNGAPKSGEDTAKIKNSRALFFFCLVMSLVPDIDNLAAFIGPEYYILHHRGATHSFVGGFVMAVVMAVAMMGIGRIFNKKFTFLELLAIGYGLTLCHIFLDLITSYGTRIFYPFTDKRYSIPSVFIIDPFFTLSMALALWLSSRSARRKRVIGMAGLLWMLLWPGVNFGVGRVISHRAAHDPATGAHERIVVLPDPFAPFFWKVLVDEGDSYQSAGMRLFNPYTPIRYTRHEKVDPDLLKRLARRAPFFGTYAWFVDYPVVETASFDGATRMIFTDLKYIATSDFLRRRFKGRKPPFSLVAVFDAQKRMTGYVWRGAMKKI